MHDRDKHEKTAAETAPRADAAGDDAGAPENADDSRVVKPGVWAGPPQSGAKAGEAAADAPEDVDAGKEDTAGQVSRLSAEKSDLTDRLLRAVAEMENLRKRAERDLNDARRYAVSRFAGDLLAVSDNMQRALASVSDEWLAGVDETTKGVLDGVGVTARELERVLEKHGVKKIAAKGERFDPHQHQAMFEVPNSDVPPGTVIEEVQPGYMIGDRVLRAAMVGVARGGPKPGNGDEPGEKAEAAPEEASGEASMSERPEGGETSSNAA